MTKLLPDFFPIECSGWNPKDLFSSLCQEKSFTVSCNQNRFLEEVLLNIIFFGVSKNKSTLIVVENLEQKEKIEKRLKSNYLFPLVLDSKDKNNSLLEIAKEAIKSIYKVNQDVVFLKKHALYFQKKEQDALLTYNENDNVLHQKDTFSQFTLYQSINHFYSLDTKLSNSFENMIIPDYKEWHTYKPIYQEWASINKVFSETCMFFKPNVFWNYTLREALEKIKKTKLLCQELQDAFIDEKLKNVSLSRILNQSQFNENHNILKNKKLKNIFILNSKNRLSFEKKLLKVNQLQEKFSDYSRKIGLKNLFLSINELEFILELLNQDVEQLPQLNIQNLELIDYFEFKRKPNINVLKKKIVRGIQLKNKKLEFEKKIESYYGFSYLFINNLIKSYENSNQNEFVFDFNLNEKLLLFRQAISSILQNYEQFSFNEILRWIQDYNDLRFKANYGLLYKVKSAPVEIKNLFFNEIFEVESMDKAVAKKLVNQIWLQTKIKYRFFNPAFSFIVEDIRNLRDQKYVANRLFIAEKGYQKLKKSISAQKVINPFLNSDSENKLDEQLNNYSQKLLFKLIKKFKLIYLNDVQNIINLEDVHQIVEIKNQSILCSKNINFQERISSSIVINNPNLDESILDFNQVDDIKKHIYLKLKNHLTSISLVSLGNIQCYKVNNKYIAVMDPNWSYSKDLESLISSKLQILIIHPAFWYFFEETYEKMIQNWVSK